VKPKRRSPISGELFDKLVRIGQDANLSYKEIMEQIPISPDQIRYAIKKGQIPRREFDYDKMIQSRVLGGRNSALVRWGHFYDD